MNLPGAYAGVDERFWLKVRMLMRINKRKPDKASIKYLDKDEYGLDLNYLG